MATSLLYLSPYLGPCFILVTAGSGGIYIYSCYSYYGCCGVAKIAIKVTYNIVIGTTSNTVVKIANRINKGFCRHYCRHCYRYY